MSHVLQTVQTGKTFPRSQGQRSVCTVYPQRSGSAYHTSNDLQRHVKTRRGVRTVDQTLRQDDRYLDPTIARRRCSTQSPRNRSPGDTGGRKRLRHTSRPQIMSSAPSDLASPTDDESSQAVLPLSEFTAVKETFLKAFSQCSEILFLSISCALSCVLRSFRPLRRTEIAGAVILYLASRSVSTAEFVCEKDLSASWLDECRGILTEDENGYIHFAQSSFRLFLNNYQIHGIDSTHATISIICLLQLEIQAPQQVRQNAQSACAKAQRLATQALAEYAAGAWIRHYRMIQDTRADITRRVHELLCRRCNAGAQNVSRSNSTSSYADAPVEALDFCVKTDLHVLAELYQHGKQNRDHTSVRHQAPKMEISGLNTGSNVVSSSKIVRTYSLASDIQSANEAFEQLDVTDSADTTSSSDCEGWIKLREQHR